MGNKLITSSEANTNRLRFRIIDKWLCWQESLHFTAIELGLERCRRVANNMGLLNPSYNVISVAGTNGKGSVAHMLASVLQEAGYNTGLYTSPHLKDFRERIKVNGKLISKNSIISFIFSVWSDALVIGLLFST